jgi:cyclopropane fatty-acyl-phospholipid synthase-like methyltransferase
MKRVFSAPGICVLVLVAAAPGPSERTPVLAPVDVPALTERLGVVARVEGQERTPEEYAKFLEGAERVARMQVPRVVAALQLKPGMKVADIGSGSGLFTRPMAHAVAPDGLAYAVDIDAALLKIVARRAAEQQITNLRIVHADAADPRLPERVDLALVCDTLHHIQQPGAYLQTLKKYLKPDGRIAVIDFSANWPQGHEPMRYSPDQLEGWMEAAGMTRVTSHDWLDNSFFMIYAAVSKPEQSPPATVPRNPD